MFDQRAFIERVERANTAEFARLLALPTYEEEAAQQAHFGDECYQRLHAAALPIAAPETQRGVSEWLGQPDRQTSRLQGNVVLLPGFMGSELSTIETVGGQGSRIWLNLLRLALGQIDRLSLAPNGTGAGFEVRATGILKSYYGQALLALARSWNAQAFWYDWRKNLDEAADQLRFEIDRWFGFDAAVHLVAHAMGGLVCRNFIKRHPDRWKTMWDAERNGERGGRLVMLGTPNHGSYLMLQTVCGLAGTIRKLAIVDQWHDTSEITRILNTFVGSFQMLPSPEREPAAEPYYNARTYGDLNVPQSVLDVARAHHRFLSEVTGGERMVYIAGSNQPTLAGLSDPSRLRDPTAYLGTTQGDGSVSHALGLLKGVRTYFIEEEHSALTGNAKVLAALDDLMIKGTTDFLAGGQVVRGKPRMFKLARWADAGKAADEREAAELSRAQDPSRQLRRRIAPALRGSDKEATVSDSEAQRVRVRKSIIVTHWLYRAWWYSSTRTSLVTLIDLRTLSLNERVLRDLLTSSFLSSKGPDVAATASLEKFRPTVVFRLFWGRIDMVRELCWALSRYGKKHLATLLIGSGNGNLSVRQCVEAWVRGLHRPAPRLAAS